MRKVNVGVIGCGHISSIYLKNLTENLDVVEVVACADLDLEVAKKRAEEFGIAEYCSVDELLTKDEIEIILNLTVPQAHAKVSLNILKAGKHVYSEKPLALNREDAKELLSFARKQGLLIGCAPDTFLGAGLQTCRKVLDDGWIGTPYAASAQIIMGHAYEAMHPQFPSLLQMGWDPIFDMGPYYLTALVNFFGPVRRVAGSTGKIQEQFMVSNPKSPFYEQQYPVDAPMHATAILDFDHGVTANLQASKESFGYKPRFQIYGTDGILHVPDPNNFDGNVRIERPDQEIKEIPYSHQLTENFRGVGVADMAYGLQSGRKHRSNGDLASHIIDISLGIIESSNSGAFVSVETELDKPKALPMGLKYNQLDL